MKGSPLIRLLLVGASLTIGVGTAEVVVRMVLPQELGLLAPWYQSHPVYRFRHYPNLNDTRTWGLPYRLQTNSRGIRSDREEPYESPTERRIVVHGDSMTFGVGVDERDTFVGRTEQWLRRRMHDVDVLNLAVAGHGPDQEYLLFLEEGRKYAPRIAVIAVCVDNDLDDLTRPHTAFRLDGDRLAYVPYEASLLKRLAEHGLYRWAAGRSHLLALARNQLVDRPLHAREFALREAQAPPIALALAVYRQFVTAAQREGAVPLIVLLPSREQVARRRMIPFEPPSEWSQLLRDALLEFCAAESVACLDAIEGFARTELVFNGLFIPGDGHYSAAGHRVVADLVAERLERMLVESGRR